MGGGGGGNHKESPVKEVEVAWACEEKRGTLRRKEGGEMKVQGRRKRGRPKRRWLDKVKDDIKEKGLMKCTTVLHGDVCSVHRPHLKLGIR